VFTSESVITMGMSATLSGSVGTPVALVTFVRLLQSCSGHHPPTLFRQQLTNQTTTLPSQNSRFEMSL
jgi:hypothetical protein